MLVHHKILLMTPPPALNPNGKASRKLDQRKLNCLNTLKLRVQPQVWGEFRIEFDRRAWTRTAPHDLQASPADSNKDWSMHDRQILSLVRRLDNE